MRPAHRELEPASDAVEVDCSAVRIALQEHVARARDAEDSRAVHGLRVACARLDVFLRLGRRRALRDDLRWLRRSASNLRDLDVLLESSAAGELDAQTVSSLSTERTAARAAFLEVLASERCEALLDALANVPSVSAQRARAPLERLAERVRRRGEQLLDAPAEFERHHALRRALRRLRYAREWLGMDCTAIRALQDSLGALNDALVRETWISRVERPASSALASATSDSSSLVQSLSAGALHAWRATRREILELPA